MKFIFKLFAPSIYASLFLHLLLVSSPDANAASKTAASEFKVQSQYEETLVKVLERLQTLVDRDRYRADVAASLKLTIEGGTYYLSARNLVNAKDKLQEALRIFPENPIAHLLFADVAVQEGRRDLAGRGYFDFWEHAGSQSKFLSDVLNEEERQVVASHISGRLFLYGMELPGDEHPKDLPLRLNLSDTKKKSFSDVIVSFALPTLIAIGIPFFIFTRFFSSDASPNADRLLFQVYLVILLSYLLWLAQQHLKFGPFFFAPKFEIFIFFTGGLCVVLALQVLRNVWEHERERLNPETVFCRYCGKSILKLAIVCPFCNEEVHAKTRKK